MPDFLDKVISDIQETIESGYYQTDTIDHQLLSLQQRIQECKKNPIISEIKLSSPSGFTMTPSVNIVDLAQTMTTVGVVGISVLTEPKHFGGSIHSFLSIRRTVNIPLLMKDFIISREQIDAAKNIGADVILFIQSLFEREYCEQPLEKMVDYAHSSNMEVLLETHTENEFVKALQSKADIVGINNRDLKTLSVDLNTTRKVLTNYVQRPNKIIVSESGIKKPQDIIFLRNVGAQAFLIGTSIMSASNIEEKITQLVEA